VKILLCNNLVRHGSGIDTLVSIEARGLTALGHHVEQFQRDNSDLDKTHGLAKARILASCLYSTSTRRELSALLAGGAVDIVHVHNTVPLLTGAVWDACSAAGVPTVQHLHNYRAFCLSSYAYRNGAGCDLCWHSGFTANVVFKCYRRSYAASAALTAARWLDWTRGRRTGYDAAAYIACSQWVKERHLAHGLPAERVTVLHNSAEDLGGLLQRSGDTPPATSRKLTFVGSVMKAKGIHAVLDLAPHLPEFEFQVLGTGEEMPAVELRVERERLSNVVLHGIVQGKQKARLWADSFLTLVPSLWDEPFALVAPESFSLGVPLLTTGAGGLRELVSTGATGFQHDFRDMADAAAQVRRLWEDVDQYRRMRSQVRALYDELFSESAYAADLAAVLEGVIANRPT
jgi:glycosyltransferase involved in cell wall biosynthesis